jgi:hypothetical protein
MVNLLSLKKLVKDQDAARPGPRAQNLEKYIQSHNFFVMNKYLYIQNRNPFEMNKSLYIHQGMVHAPKLSPKEP